jgi:hypothetical protein
MPNLTQMSSLLPPPNGAHRNANAIMSSRSRGSLRQSVTASSISHRLCAHLHNVHLNGRTPRHGTM